MKFKVGDKVRVRDDLAIGESYGTVYDSLMFLRDMEEFKGKICVVKEVVKLSYRTRYVLENCGGWYFSSEMLEPVIEPQAVEEPMEKLVIYRDGDRFIAKYYKGDKVVSAETESVCNFGTVSDCLLTEVLDKMKQEEIGYTWVKCVGYRQNYEFNFTIGHVYKIYDNGKITSDNGYTYGDKYFNKTKEETLDFLSDWYIFEEVDKSENPS